MKIVECEQNSLEWLVLRAGKPTASEFSQLLTPKFEIRTGEMPKTFLARKLAEAWIDGPLPGHQSIDMEIGKILEDEAKPKYTLEYGDEITNVGFITTDDGRIGCSPDGLIGDDGGIEIKCPLAETHVKYLLAGKVPDDYITQVHGALYVTGRPWWRFMSYRRRFPTLMVQVNRDPEIIEAIHEALTEFLSRFDTAWSKLCDMNGGPPRNNFQSAITRENWPNNHGTGQASDRLEENYEGITP